MPLVALTGGIASGKSTIARRLAEHGAVVVDADAIVRSVQAPGSPVLAAIADEFGGDVILADGTLDRAALAGRVFGHPDRVARLNAIVHPAVRAESHRRFEEAFADDAWDRVVVAHAPAAERAARLVALRGMTEAEAGARIASQASDEERLRLADVVIDTSGTIEDTLRQVDVLWTELHPRP